MESALVTRRIDVHNHGHVVLEDAMGSDLHIVNNARVSFDQESDEMTDKERGLLRFLMRERHGSPWESVVFRFDVKAPLFVFREWHRHRLASINEQSARYSVIPDHFYVPGPEYDANRSASPVRTHSNRSRIRIWSSKRSTPLNRPSGTASMLTIGCSNTVSQKSLLAPCFPWACSAA
jgi:thymidylate synthase ThyX